MRLGDFIKKYNYSILFVIFIIAISFRVFVTSQDSIPFYYDQGRDFYIARQIAEGDFKIFGPRASGTNDTLYHGVAYYYFLAFVLRFISGNIHTAAVFMGILTALSTIAIYFVVKKLSSSIKWSLIGSLLFAFSLELAHIGTWLSNASLLIVTISFFYYFLWLSLFDKKINYLPLMFLFLGLSNQASVHTLYLWVSVMLSYLYIFSKTGKKIQLNGKIILKSSLVYLLSISTMLAAQTKLLLAGIYPSLESYASQFSVINRLRTLTGLYGNLAKWSFSPSWPIISIIFILPLFIWIIQQKITKKYVFLFIWLFTPLAFLIIQDRNNYHSLAGISPALLILFILFLQDISSELYGKISSVILLFIIIIGNLLAAITFRQKRIHVINQVEQVLLAEQKKLIDKTYEISNGESFTISPITAPYGLYSAWLYLYEWYGNQKYGYSPNYIGFDQTGIAAGNYSEKTDHPGTYHFSIYEPIAVSKKMPLQIIDKFSDEQNKIAKETEEKIFFSNLLLEIRQPEIR